MHAWDTRAQMYMCTPVDMCVFCLHRTSQARVQAEVWHLPAQDTTRPRTPQGYGGAGWGPPERPGAAAVICTYTRVQTYMCTPMDGRDTLLYGTSQARAQAAVGEDGAPLSAQEQRLACEEQTGAQRGAQGQWASCIRIVDPATLQVGLGVPSWLQWRVLGWQWSCLTALGDDGMAMVPV